VDGVVVAGEQVVCHTPIKHHPSDLVNTLDVTTVRVFNRDMPTATHTHEHYGFTLFSRWVGRCRTCKAAVRIEVPATDPIGSMWYIDWERKTVCECGAAVKVKLVNGVVSDKVCNSRCMGAVGPACECSCGGENHGGR
jgi:hypothetical protein